MARIAFSSALEEMVGSLAGTTFQDSYFGLQLRTRVTPANPRSPFQMLRRGEFSYITQGWRNLTAPQLASWVAAAGTIPAAFRLYTQCNINLSLLDIAPVYTFIPSSVPGTMALGITDMQSASLQVKATSATTAVPAGQRLLLRATATFPVQRQFVNISAYSPVQSFAAGTNFATSVSIYADWVIRFGVLDPSKQICISSSLINTTNGLRGASVESCIIGPVYPFDFIIDSDGTFTIDLDATFLINA